MINLLKPICRFTLKQVSLVAVRIDQPRAKYEIVSKKVIKFGYTS